MYQPSNPHLPIKAGILEINMSNGKDGDNAIRNDNSNYLNDNSQQTDEQTEDEQNRMNDDSNTTSGLDDSQTDNIMYDISEIMSERQNDDGDDFNMDDSEHMAAEVRASFNQSRHYNPRGSLIMQHLNRTSSNKSEDSFVIPDTFLSDSYLASSTFGLPRMDELRNSDDDHDDNDNNDAKPAATTRYPLTDAEKGALEASQQFKVADTLAAEAEAVERDLELFQAQQAAAKAEEEMEAIRREMEDRHRLAANVKAKKERSSVARMQLQQALGEAVPPIEEIPEHEEEDGESGEEAEITETGHEEEDVVAPLRPSYSNRSSVSTSTLAVPLLKDLEDVVAKHGDDTFATFYEADGKATQTLTFGKAWEDAGTLAYHLRYTWEVNKGEHVVLCLDYGLSYISAWLGCLRCGVVPILVGSPIAPFDDHLTKMNLIIKAASPVALILTDSVVEYWKKEDTADRNSSSRLMWPMDAPWHCVDKLPEKRSSFQKGAARARMSIFGGGGGGPAARKSFFWRQPAAPSASSEDASGSPRTSFLSSQDSDDRDSFDERTLVPDDVACFQHTTGSTGDPKVVAITFVALYEAIQMTRMSLTTIFQDGAALEGFSWLPPDHHLGLFLTMLCPFMSGCHMHLMSSMTFEQSPLQWLELMSRYKIAWTAAPDPAYRLVMRKFELLTAEKKNAMNMNFRSLRHLLNIGEALRYDTVSRFRKLFGPYRLHKECDVIAGYGLAESVLAVSWIQKEYVFVPTTLNVAPTNWVAVARRLILPKEVTILVVDPTTRTRAGNGVVGEVWVHNPAVLALGKIGGYHKNKKLSKKIFQARLKGSKQKFLRTGDLGFWEIDHLYICGRSKDAMTNKENIKYYPPDVEWVAEDARPEVKPGCVAAYSSVGGTVEVVFEVFKSTNGKTVKAVCRDVAKAITESTGIEPSSVLAVSEGSLPKTQEGLVLRRLTKTKILKEKITILYDYPERRDRVVVPDIQTIMEEQAIPDLKSIIESRSKKTQVKFGEQKILTHLHGSELDNILARYVGSGFDNELSWEELGLTSFASVPLRRDIETQMYVTLAPDCLDRYPTPSSLKEHILESSGNPLMTDALYLQLSQSSHLSWWSTGFLQILLSLLIVVLFAVPVLPCYIAYESLKTYELMLLLMVPIWMVTFSFLVIMAKWLVIGRYKQSRVVTPSFFYVRWWFVDRLVDLWEIWVGHFIKNTPLLWWFYIAMGAKLDPTCQLDAFLREFDLVTLGENTVLKCHTIKCRKFSSWERFERGPLMAFRPISVGNRCVIRGILSPGVKIGNGVYVEMLSVVPEGADVEDNVKLTGNPAFVADEKDESDSPRFPYWLPVGISKMAWVLVELSLLYGMWIGAEYINAAPGDVAVGTVDYWLIFGATCILLSLLSSIVVKLLLVGKRRPGKLSRFWCYHLADWAADYHFLLVTLPFRLFARNSRLCNIILMLHGMDIDLVSKVEMESFPPSKLDLVSVHRSFMETVTFDIKSDGVFHRTVIEAASLGQFCHIASGVTVVQSIIPPLSIVNENVLGERLKKKHQMSHSCRLYAKEIATFVLDLVVLGAVLFTIVPAYFVWSLTFDALSLLTIIPICAASLLAQSIAWFVVIWVVQAVTYFGVRIPMFRFFHGVYKNSFDTYQHWSLFRVIWGTLMFRLVGWMLGAAFEGRILYFGERMYDFGAISADSRTVIDGATVVGHNIVYDRLRFGACRVSGLVRVRTFVMAEASITRKESGPSHVITKASSTVTRKPSMLKPMIARA